VNVDLRPIVARGQQAEVQRYLQEGGSTDVQYYLAEVGTSWRLRRYSVLRTRDPIHLPNDTPDLRWHISIAGEQDVPPWNHLVAIGHKVRPGVVFVVGVPPKSWWMSVHPHCLHLYETKDANLIAQWKAESQGHTPT
jgi:hypothetical protein